MATINWTGNIDGDLTNVGNWDTAVPTTGDAVVIDVANFTGASANPSTGTCTSDTVVINYATQIDGGTYSGTPNNSGAITGGTWNGDNALNAGTISGGTFTGTNFNNGYNGNITGGAFTGSGFTVDYGGVITDGHFTGSGLVITPSGGSAGAIYGGTFDGDVSSGSFNVMFLIYGGTFNSTVNIAVIVVGGTFNDGLTTQNDISGGEVFGGFLTYYNISGGTFHGAVNEYGYSYANVISGGTFNSTVYTQVPITGGTFVGAISLSNVQVSGGNFYGDVVFGSGSGTPTGQYPYFLGHVEVQSYADIESGTFVGTLQVNPGSTFNFASTYISMWGLQGLKMYDSPVFTLAKGINGSGILGLL